MNDTPFTNREIREFISDIKGDIKEIKAQTIRTNGRVSQLENWRAYMLGGLSIVTLMIVPILLYLITHEL